jgi:hypothetical protein
MTMQFKWNPAGKGNALHGSDGSEWNVGVLGNGCNVLMGRDGQNVWSTTCTVHGVLGIGGGLSVYDAGSAWMAAMRHNPDHPSYAA